MKHPFKLSKTNLIYMAVVAIIISLHQILTAGFDAVVLGQVFGVLLILFTIPFLGAFLFWFISGRKASAGTSVFNIILSLLILLWILQMAEKLSV